MNAALTFRLATDADIPAPEALTDAATGERMSPFLTPAQGQPPHPGSPQTFRHPGDQMLVK